MKLIPSGTAYDRIVRHGSIQDGPVVDVVGVAHRGKQIAADRVRLTYRATDGQWVCTEARIYGFLLRKNGTVGAMDTYQDFADPCLTSSTPKWVKDIAWHLAPPEQAPSVQHLPLTTPA